MNNEDILGEIAYLDTDLDKKSRAAIFSSSEMAALVRDAIQIAMAKQGHLRMAEDVSARVASLEERMEVMRREIIRQRGTPTVIYVRRRSVVAPPVKLSHQLDSESNQLLLPARTKLPTAMVAFYASGLVCSLVFATLLALSAIKVDTIHPFISLLGFIGGLGWLTTAWTDLLLRKRENPSAATTATAKAWTPTASSAR